MGRARGEMTLQFAPPCFKLSSMTQPLALILYKQLLPGSQVVNRLRDMGYRVQVIADPASVVECAEHAKPMLVLADLNCVETATCAALARLRNHEPTRHLPVIGFGGDGKAEVQSAALAAGVTLVVSEAAILHHLPECLDQALRVE